MSSTSKVAAKKGLLIAAPNSGSGKTVITLALLRALKNRHIDICGAKAGPDFIDPAFHEVASGLPSVNLDPWAMSQNRLRYLAHRQPSAHVLVEGMMGLFDGAADGSGSAADLAAMLDIPVVLVVDCAKQSHSFAALFGGFLAHRPGLAFAGLILNRIGSPRHEVMLRNALKPLGVAVLGAIPRDADLELPERHLGLVQATEHEGIEPFMENAAARIAESVDLEAVVDAFAPVTGFDDGSADAGPLTLPPGKRIAIARDNAFRFAYPHQLGDWQLSGSEILWFSPLADEPVPEQADHIYLPGGYPELHADTLAGALQFKQSMIEAARRGVSVYGECGGYMVLGNQLIDANGVSHDMLGLLDLVTSFEKRKLHLGYRRVQAAKCAYAAHEFHYTSAAHEVGEPLFVAEDATGAALGAMGLINANVRGSYLHMIDPHEPFSGGNAK